LRCQLPHFLLVPAHACLCVGRWRSSPSARPFCQACAQEAGEAIFVPSGWHHEVENLADTLSVNANWLNAFNAHWAVALLRRERAQAAAAIEDCRRARARRAPSQLLVA
jgi:oxalate decarboxylase/phosphoglucose isomerase-like protein (cupin superfamily)